MEETNISKVAEEIKEATDEELKKKIEEWYERIHTQSMRLGAKYIAAGTLGAIQKNLNKAKPSLRDYERCIKDIRKIIAVQLTEQNDSEETIVEEKENDGTTESNDNTNS
jgi:hypothetical protein